MRTVGTFLFLCAVLAVIAAAAYFQFFVGEGGRGGEDGPGKQAVLVTVVPVKNHDFVDVIEAVGTAKANESVELTAKASETIGAVNFEGGQKVEAGFVVAELTSREQSADLAAARAELNEAKQNFDRINELSAKGFATKAQLEQATSARDSAAAKVRSLESRVTDRLIKAPFAGVLGLRRVSVGSLVKPGDVITTLDDISLMKVDFTVPEVFLGALSVGMPIRAGVEAYAGRAFDGKVVGIDTRVDPVSRSVAVRAEIANRDNVLRSGMLMTVALLKNQRVSLSVPEQSLVPLNDQQYVYVVTPDMKAERREVKIGARSPGTVEIVSGLKAGEKVVVDGTIRLRPGATVRLAGPEQGDRKRKNNAAGDAGGPRT